MLGVPPGSSQTPLSVTLNTSVHCALSRAPRSYPGQGNTLTGLSLATPSPQLASTLGHVLFLKQAAGEGTCGSNSLALGSFTRLLTSCLLKTTSALPPGCSQPCSAQPRDPPCGITEGSTVHAQTERIHRRAAPGFTRASVSSSYRR